MLKKTEEKGTSISFPSLLSQFCFFDLNLFSSSFSLKPRLTPLSTHSSSSSSSFSNDHHNQQGISLPKDASQVRFRLVDAKDQVVGRLAAQLARILQGKDKPTFAPNGVDGGAGGCGDVVIVKNAAHVAFTGRKWDDKLYRWHSGYPGGLKERTAGDEASGDPTAPLRRAVYGMLPKNALRASRARKLRVFAGERHPFEDDPRVVPWSPPRRTLRVKEAAPELPEGFAPLNSEAFAHRFRAHKGFAAPSAGAGDGSIPMASGGK